MKKERSVIFLVLTLIIFHSCGQEKARDHALCNELNSQAFEKLNDYLYRTSSKNDLITSLELYDSAINCDSMNPISYQGKATVLRLLKRHRDLLGLLDKLFQLSDKTDAKVLVSKGILYGKMGIRDSSDMAFDQAFTLYDSVLRNNPPDSLKLICERIYLTAITQNKETAVQELAPYLVKYPNDPSIKSCEAILLNFDKKTIFEDNDP